MVGRLGLGEEASPGDEQAGIDGPRPPERFSVDRDVDQGIEVTDRVDVTRFGPLNAEIFGLAVDAFTGGSLLIDSLVEGAIPIQSDAHESARLDVDVLDAALAKGLLLMWTGLARPSWIEQGAAVALGAVAVGMLELVGGVHAQAFWTARHAVWVTSVNRMSMLV